MGCINVGMGESQLYGIGNLIWRSGITISSQLLTIGRQWNSTRRTNLRYGKRSFFEEGDGEGGEDEDQENDQENGEDAVKRGNSEQQEADTNVQDQDGSKSGDQYEDGDTQDNGRRQDNWEEHRKP